MYGIKEISTLTTPPTFVRWLPSPIVDTDLPFLLADKEKAERFAQRLNFAADVGQAYEVAVFGGQG